MTLSTAQPAVTGLTSWFGSNRTLAANVGEELAGCKHVTIPFAGSLTEALAIDARTLVVGDVHRHLINLFSVAADPVQGPQLYRRLRRLPLHPEVLSLAQERCAVREGVANAEAGLFGHAGPEVDPRADRLAWAVDYFVTSWFGQGGRSGTSGEFRGPMSVRFDAGGGDSCRRLRSAVASIPAWRKLVLSGCTFQTIDFRRLLAKVRDLPGNGVYCDPPFPGAGDGYRHSFTKNDHRDLARIVAGFRHARVVVRYYRHPLVEELYCGVGWAWRTFAGRDQQNRADKPELLILNGPSRAVASVEPLVGLTPRQRHLLAEIQRGRCYAVRPDEQSSWSSLRFDATGEVRPVEDADVRALIRGGHLQVDTARNVAHAAGGAS